MHDSPAPSPGKRYSIRLHPGAQGSGLRAWSYPIEAKIVVGTVLSPAVRGGEAGQTLTVGFEALWDKAETPFSGRRGARRAVLVHTATGHFAPE